MQTTDKHTPTPWEKPRDFDFPTQPLCLIQPVEPSANDGMAIAHFFGPDRVDNAEMVWKAVNNHAALVEALRALQNDKRIALGMTHRKRINSALAALD